MILNWYPDIPLFSLELGENLIQFLSKCIHFLFLHSNSSSSCEIGTGVAVKVGSPVVECVWTYCLFSARYYNPVCNI